MQIDWKNNLVESRKLYDRFNSHYDNPVVAVSKQVLAIMLATVKLSCDVDGDLAECGVAWGGSSYAIAHAMSDGKKLHCFDSWEGLPEPTEQDRKSDGSFLVAKGMFRSATLEDAKSNLTLFGDKICYYKGWFRNTLLGVSNLKFSFVHIDSDLYESTIECIKFFFPRLSIGGFMELDDAVWSFLPGVNKAITKYFGDIFSKSYLDVFRFESHIVIKKLGDRDD